MINGDNLLSVCIITYNHESFISEAIEGILMQECSFPIEIYIGEDHSTDKTKNICQEYADKNQNINIIFSERNLGVVQNFTTTLKACQGKYIALCEGDDYWTDPMKLQKQFDFMEENPECSLVHTNGYIRKRNKLIPWNNWASLEGDVKQTFYYGPSARTCSVLIRATLLQDYFNLLKYSKIKIIGDWPLFAYYSTKGKFGYINERMAVYRLHPNSVSSNKSLITHYKYSLDVIEVKRFLRDYIFNGRLDDMYSEQNLLKELNHIHLKYSFDTWNIKEAKRYAQAKELNPKSKKLAFFSKNLLFFTIGCSYKWIKNHIK